MSDREALDDRQILRAAVNVGANISRVENDLRRRTQRSRVTEDAIDAQSFPPAARPVFFTNGRIYTGTSNRTRSSQNSTQLARPLNGRRRESTHRDGPTHLRARGRRELPESDSPSRNGFLMTQPPSS